MFKITKKQKFRERIFDLNLNYLNKHYGSCFVNQEKEEHIPENFNIYVFWWQGINESTPELVKTCIHLAQVNNPNNKVIILTKDNFKDYSDIPDYILEKLDKGIITITHFSDILRASVLSNTGGGWMDATLLCTSPLGNLSQYCFYSNKLPADKRYDYNVGKAQWSAFFLCCGKNNTILTNLKNVLYEYWKTHTTLIAYFLIDYVIKLSQIKCESARDMIKQVPENNLNIHDLQPIMFETFNQEHFQNLTKDTHLFKLTYRFDKKNLDLENTYYKHIINLK